MPESATKTPTRRQYTAEDMRQGVHSVLRASYDAAQTTDENRMHWGRADDLSPSAGLTGNVRKIIRRRARYEVANNSIAKGIVNTLANHVVGTGPRLQMATGDDALDRQIEAAWSTWARGVRLASKLRTMRKAKATDGEAFGVLTTNRGLPNPVKLDVRLVEAERVATPNFGVLPPDERAAIDGIIFDEWGNPSIYHVLRSHPGAARIPLEPWAAIDIVPARSMLHWFTVDRAEQKRGLPDIMPALPLFALLRRFTLATLTSAEAAAYFSVIMKTNSPADGEAADVPPWITQEMVRSTMIYCPEGWEPSQLRPEHPAATFGPFRRAIITEAGRCLDMPYNIAAGDSAEYNFASGRLDHERYFTAICVDREDLEGVALDRIFAAWLAEALRITGHRLTGQISRASWPHDWLWPGRQEIDPRWAKTEIARVQAGLDTEADYHARRGHDWRTVLDQREREAKLRTEKGLPQPWEKSPAAPGASS